MKKTSAKTTLIISLLLLVISSFMIFAGIRLNMQVTEQYRIESINPTDEQLRAQVDAAYSAVTEEDINQAKTSVGDVEDEEEFILNRIENLRVVCDETSVYQNSRGFNNALKIAVRKLDIVLSDIDTGAVDIWRALVVSIRINDEVGEYEDIIKVPYSDEFNFFRTVEKLSFLSVVLIISGIVGVIAIFIFILILICKHKRAAVLPHAEAQEKI